MTGLPIDEATLARFRARAWETIALVRDAAPRVPDDATTDDIIDALIDSGLVNDLIAEAFRRGQASPSAPDPTLGEEPIREQIARLQAQRSQP